MRPPKILRLAACAALLNAGLRPAAARAQRTRPNANRPATASLAGRIDRIIDAPPYGRGLWGISIVDPAGRTVYERNADRLFVTASTAKLLISATATVLLGPDYRFRTTLYAAGTVRDSVLAGDLVLFGRGDPTIAGGTAPSVALARLASAVRRRGVTRVTGDLVADASWFSGPDVHPSWEASDLAYGFAAPAAALGYNAGAVAVSVTPGLPGDPPALELTPDLGLVVLHNRARTVPVDSPSTFAWARTPGRNEFTATGDVPVDARPWTDDLALTDGPAWAGAAFRQALEAAGVSIDGTVRVVRDSLATATARLTEPVGEWRSPPLSDVLRPILESSNNWYAEMLLRTVGRERAGEGSAAAGLAVERRFLIDELRVDSTMFRLVDGSGLSHHDVVTPRAFVTMLQAMRRHPRGAAFLEALAQPGSPGTLHYRFRYGRPEGQVRAKTGSITGTNALVGYLETADDRAWTFAIHVNNHLLSTRDVLRRIDAIVTELTR